LHCGDRPQTLHCVVVQSEEKTEKTHPGVCLAPMNLDGFFLKKNKKILIGRADVDFVDMEVIG